MYVAPDYAEPDLDEVVRLIEAQPFATLVTDQPDLRIIDQELQEKVKARQGALQGNRSRGEASDQSRPFA